MASVGSLLIGILPNVIIEPKCVYRLLASLGAVIWITSLTGCGSADDNPASGADVTATALKQEDLFPTDRLIRVDIELPRRDWDKIRHQTRSYYQALHAKRQFGEMDSPYTYVEAKVTIDGVEFSQVGLRKKGFIGSQSHSRPSLKIKLNHTDKEGEIDGVTMLTLNNNK